MKIISVVGARAQFIKVKPVASELAKRSVTHVLVHTGQHYDYEMSQQFFEELDIPEPNYNLQVGSSTHGKQLALILERVEAVLLSERPDVVVVYGDTNSTLGGALAAVKLHIMVAHVEAGLRSHRLDMPEEVNRVLTDHVSRYLFCPTSTAVDNLKKEGITGGVHLVGDVMYDVLLSNFEALEKTSKILERLSLRPKDYYLATIHRAENTNSKHRLSEIIAAFCGLDKEVIFPAHPRTRKMLQAFDIEVDSRVWLIDPVSYVDMLTLEMNATKVLTDSGGVQKESHIVGTPCVTIRNETEWPETLEGGWNVLAGADKERIISCALAPIEKTGEGGESRIKLYGDGDAARKLVDVLLTNPEVC